MVYKLKDARTGLHCAFVQVCCERCAQATSTCQLCGASTQQR
jgi:hypothetical protein